MIIFQVSLNFDLAEEILKMRYQIYILMKKIIILSKTQATMESFAPSFWNHFSLSLKRKKHVVGRAMTKKLQKQSFADILQTFTGKHLCWSQHY